MLFRETKMFNGAKQSSEHIAIGIYLLFVMGAMRTPHVYFYVKLSFALIAWLGPFLRAAFGFKIILFWAEDRN